VSLVAAQESLIEAYRSRRPELACGGTGWLEELRGRAARRFEEVGLPGAREEVWRHTPLDAIRGLSFRPAADDAATVPADLAERIGEAYRVVVTGSGILLDTPGNGLPHGLAIGSLGENLDGAKGRLGKLADLESPGITAVNTALFDRGVVIELAPHVTLDRPVHIVHRVESNGEPQAAFPRVVIVAGEGSEGVILEHYRSEGDLPTLTAPVTEVFVERDARLDHVRLQEESERAFHVGRVVAEQQAASRLRSWSLALGSSLARVDIETRLAGDGAECSLEGIFAGRNRQHLDHYTRIDHVSPHTSSRETYKGILDDRARGVFLGHILVRPGAQKISANQTSRSVLLSRGSRVNMKPWLEIYADDVRCTHGTTVGHLDEDALFYLRSRGIGLAEARAILLRGFAWEVLEELPVERLRAQLDHQMLTWLGNGVAGRLGS
jgi:Fe-S cluster assembly protein SufD